MPFRRGQSDGGIETTEALEALPERVTGDDRVVTLARVERRDVEVLSYSIPNLQWL